MKQKNHNDMRTYAGTSHEITFFASAYFLI